MEMLLSIVAPIVVACVTALFTYYLTNKKAKKKITDDLTASFYQDNEKFRKEVWAKYKEVSEKNSELDEALESYKCEYSALLEQYKKLETAHKEVLAKYNDIQQQFDSIHKELAVTKKQRDEMHTEVKKLQSILNNMKKKPSSRKKK